MANSDLTIKIYDFMKTNSSKAVTAEELANFLGEDTKRVRGTLLTMARRKHVDKADRTVNRDGKDVVEKTNMLNSEGMAYDPRA